MIRALSPDEVLELPAVVDLATAGQALGIGRTKAHELARAGELPLPVIRIGSAYRVRRADLLAWLKISDDRPEPTSSTTTTAPKPADDCHRTSRPRSPTSRDL
jgi:excisionase family DNA binding protein